MRWLAPLLVALACVAAGPQPASAIPVSVPTRGPEIGLVAQPSSSATSRKRLAVQLAGAVRDLRRSAARTIQQPANPFFRIDFTTEAALLSRLIHLVREAGGLGRKANAAQLVLVQVTRKVRTAQDQAESKSQVPAVVAQLDSLLFDAARASGARTDEELNAFKKAHLADLRYASRRWLVDRAVGRQGAVIISRGVRNPRLRNAIEQLYRYSADIGDGGTADALLVEVKAGCRTSACKHFLKAVGYRKNLLTIRRRESLSSIETGITDELVKALTAAIRAAGGA